MRIQRHARLTAGIADLAKYAMQMRACLDVYGDGIRATIGESLNEAFRFDDHQVHIQRNPRHLRHGLDHHRTHGDVRNKAAIHDIDMNQIGAGVLRFYNLLAQSAEVRCQYGRCNFDRS